MTQQADTLREPEHLRRIKSQLAAWDEADVDKRLIRLAAWHTKVAQLSAVSGPVREITTHNRPHADEVLEFFLGAKYSSPLFGDIRHIINLEHLEDEERPFGQGIVLRTDTGPSYRGTDWLTNWRNGIRLLGTGGSVLDEHPTASDSEVEKESGATLMARILGVVDKDELARILNAVRLNDTQAIQSALINELTKIREEYEVTDWQGKPKGGPEDKANQLIVLRKKLLWLNTFVEREIRVIQEFKNKGFVLDIDGRGDILIGRIRSSIPKMIGYIQEKFGTCMNMQISDGHPVILPDKKKVPMEVINEIAAAIRTEEARIQGRPLPTNRATLSQKGTVECAPEWYYTYGFLMNGGDTAPGVQATHISAKRLEDIIAEVLAAKADRIREWRRAQKEERNQAYRQQARANR
ncbi:MAG: hypothetical protein AAB400_02675 [Patescibacteria group bacterium]